jgi:hypothetical protein
MRGLQIRLVKPSEVGSDSPARRSSPIHRLLPDAPVPDLKDGIWFAHLLVPPDPFVTLGKIFRRAYPALENQTWFGIGLAVQIFLREPKDILPPLDEVVLVFWTRKGAFLR